MELKTEAFWTKLSQEIRGCWHAAKTQVTGKFQEGEEQRGAQLMLSV